jgi:hypothetical protein
MVWMMDLETDMAKGLLDFLASLWSRSDEWFMCLLCSPFKRVNEYNSVDM